MSNFRQLTLGLALSSTCLSTWVLPVNAQEETTATQEAGQEESSAASKPMTLDEIVVTAQKRAENLQDVPLSVSAIGGETLREKNISGLGEVAQQTPNARIAVGGGGNGAIKMRGLGSGNNRGFEQAVGFLIDGVYYGRISYLNSGLADLERIEILRGPQGTLMGKNTIAGAVSMTTVDPTDEWEADLSYGIGSRDRSYATAIANIPLVEDAFALRLVAQRQRQDGWVENTHVNQDQLNTDKDLYRAKLGFTAIDNLTVVAAYEKGKDETNKQGLEIYKASAATMQQNQQYDPNFEAEANHQNQTDGDITAKIDTDIATLKMDYELGEYILSSVTGWTQQVLNDGIDADAGPAPLLTMRGYDDYTQYSQEFRVTSPIGDLDYVAGLYLFGSEYRNIAEIGLAQGPGAAALLQTRLPDSLQLFGIPGLDFIPEDQDNSDFYQEQRAAALFGQLRWHLLDDDLTLMAGLRYSYEEKTGTMRRWFDGPGIFFTQIQGKEEFDIPETKRTEQDMSPKLSATYALTEDMNIYGTYARAFKGGGFNAQAGTPDEFEYEPEEADTFEFGLKGKFLGGLLRVNTAAFYTKFKGLQVSVFNGDKFIVQNAADATTMGLELDSTLLAAPGLIITLSVGYTDATYDSFPDGPCPTGQGDSCDLSGRPLDRAPEWNGNLGFNYKLPLNNSWVDVVIGGDANYQGDQYTAADLDENAFQEGVTKYSARFAVQDPDLRWQLQVVGKNLTDELIMTSSADVPVQPGSYMGVFAQPRSWALDFRVRF